MIPGVFVPPVTFAVLAYFLVALVVFRRLQLVLLPPLRRLPAENDLSRLVWGIFCCNCYLMSSL